SVRYHIYDMEPYKRKLSWMPNNHYATVASVAKLAVSEILPNDVNEASGDRQTTYSQDHRIFEYISCKYPLILDADMVVLDDISPIFEAFKGTNESVLFAMTENMSPWYARFDAYPARGRGFNAGLILMNLQRMRHANFSDIWQSEARERLRVFSNANDQDILNALTVTYPDIIAKLPCEYNVQLGAIGEPETCTSNDRNVKIAHFNSIVKVALKTKYVAHFAKFHAAYQSMDGYAFRQRQRCESHNADVTYFADLPEINDDNDKLISTKNTTYRTHLYFNGFSNAISNDDVTLVTQLPADQFSVINKVLKIWKGPVSAAIYCSDAELPYISKEIESVNEAANRENVALHVVFKTGVNF
ncbi:hypothetical protein PMAYCL1PPCAC_32992, partial [Pristionchus mayeri]